MRALAVAASAAALLLAASAQAQTSSTVKPSSHDASFVAAAAAGNLAEARLGTLVEDHGGTAAVKEFGRWMSTDHRFANQRLKAVAAPLQLWQKPHLNHHQEAMEKKLEHLHGIAFDRAYMKDMVNDHAKTIAKFRKEAEQGRNPQIKRYAHNLLPVLDQHAKEARRLAGGAGMASGNPAALSGTSRPPARAAQNPPR